MTIITKIALCKLCSDTLLLPTTLPKLDRNYETRVATDRAIRSTAGSDDATAGKVGRIGYVSALGHLAQSEDQGNWRASRALGLRCILGHNLRIGPGAVTVAAQYAWSDPGPAGGNHGIDSGPRAATFAPTHSPAHAPNSHDDGAPAALWLGNGTDV